MADPNNFYINRNPTFQQYQQAERHHAERMIFDDIAFKSIRRRWVVTTIIAVIALILSIVSLAAQLGLIRFPQHQEQPVATTGDPNTALYQQPSIS